MYKLFFNDKKIVICDTSAPHGCEESVDIKNISFDLTKLLQKLQNCNSLAIVSENESESFKKISNFFHPITAAGGAVERENGDLLMILRNGRWDLPKGKMEHGEIPEKCAVREVEEECGIYGLILGGEITLTYHIYPIEETLVLKTTHWYKMSYNGIDKTTPQIEEGIIAADWIPHKEIKNYMKGTYPTITDVLEKAGY